MRAVQEESIRIGDEYFGEVYSIEGGRYYGYTATDGEDGMLIGFDFGFDTITDARNACEAAFLSYYVPIYVQSRVLEVRDGE